jgi:hypothetical protein
MTAANGRKRKTFADFELAKREAQKMLRSRTTESPLGSKEPNGHRQRKNALTGVPSCQMAGDNRGDDSKSADLDNASIRFAPVSIHGC